MCVVWTADGGQANCGAPLVAGVWGFASAFAKSSSSLEKFQRHPIARGAPRKKCLSWKPSPKAT